jgi:hypothetical protein
MEYSFIPFFDVQLFVLVAAVTPAAVTPAPAMVPAPPGMVPAPPGMVPAPPGMVPAPAATPVGVCLGYC